MGSDWDPLKSGPIPEPSSIFLTSLWSKHDLDTIHEKPNGELLSPPLSARPRISPDAPPAIEWTSPKPGVSLLYKYCSSWDYLLLITPAVILSAASGVLTPFMTVIIGSSFNAFASFPTDHAFSTKAERDQLKSDISKASFILVGMGVGFILLNALMAGLWIIIGERMARRLRNEVFTKIGSRDMTWFDLGMGVHDGGDENVKGNQEAIGAAGLMAKFTRETDEVRIATSQNVGLVVGDVFTIITSLILALMKSWNLTLVILSAVPVVIICQGVVQHISFPLLSSERRIFAAASTRSERATSSIATVKAFNAEKKEADDFFSVINNGKKVTARIIFVWGTNLGLSAFVLNTMFVAGFWYGSELVRQGGIQSGDVITVFFATVLASSSLQTIMPRFESIQKGMGAMVSLQVLINPPPIQSKLVNGDIVSSIYSQGSADRSSMISSALPSASYSIMANARPIPGRRRHRRTATLTQIRPAKCHGEFILRHVSFFYPSRPQSLALSDVTLFLPSGEFTFIVGGSGSGKSTIAQLLLQLYKPTGGSIHMDDQDTNVLDPGWMRENIASVQQGCVLFDLTVHENVAIGLAGSKSRRPEDATREEVIEACRRALIHEFITDLPDGYDTRLGTSGASLSGGQKQRIAIARAVLRDPPVLILDEATSALDLTARVLVFEAIRSWRKNRTTIVITHDLSQIEPDNFVYVVQNGSVVEEGFRSDLDRSNQAFSKMLHEQQKAPLWTGPDEIDEWDDPENVMDVLQATTTEQETPFTGFNITGAIQPIPGTIKRQTYQQGAYLDIIADYTDKPRLTRQFSSLISNGGPLNCDHRQSSNNLPIEGVLNFPDGLRKVSPSGNSFSNRVRDTIYDTFPDEFSIPAVEPTVFSPSGSCDETISWAHQETPYPTRAINKYPQHPSLNRMNGRLNSFNLLAGESTTDLERQGEIATRGRAGLLYPGSRIDRRRNNLYSSGLHGPDDGALKSEVIPEKTPGILAVIWLCVKSCPLKPLLALGFVASVGQGAITPIWSNYLSTLMALVAQGGGNPSKLQRDSLVVLGLSVANGLSIGLSMIALDIVSNQWACDMRDKCFRQIMAQQKSWFDQTENSPSALSQTLIKDADDMLAIVSDIPGKFVTSVVMIGMGIIWAAIVGWKLTLVGVAVIPVLLVSVGVQFKLLNRIELRNKRTREEIAKIFYETVSNIRAIRAMSLESIFIEKFNIALENAYTTGLKGAWIQGVGNGLMNGLVYFVEALLFYVIAVFMCDGSYTYATALRVFSLVVFSLTFGAQMLSFLPTVAKAKQAALDFQGLVARSSAVTEEGKGSLRPKITGQITFSDVRFAYPTRPEADVLSGISFDIDPGECVAIVGASGSGKSTIAALLQKLYEPGSGSIHLDRHALAEAEARWIREHISIVSQIPALFDMTVTENVAYGTHQLPFSEVERACKAAQVHDFILSLPQGYETNLGENASLISGGQAQRLQIARALVKRADILILDECTSALDSENQAAVLETIMRVRMDRTVIMITHKLPAMMACSRILVVRGGSIAEDGTFDELVRKRGVFAELARGGEWE
ncbi:Multidrug/pheromone exporter, ABC superfamily [Phaffia rhodozyma]|uniref:Multidrug/pheromone exporter, ABC superfamily n=1 Tax=Phaffia rhodozyma TaxID=264483 RepID=A0A0F7SQS9_PHARH|nr:Multidrug/pheromone exporter, ABC superfamily [Phaffia rhodozyma]